MNQNETWQLLIKLIAEYQFANPGKKLKVGALSTQAGISRQAFHRYYGDLKPYASGLKPVAQLLAGSDSTETSQLLSQSHETLLDLTKKLALQEKQLANEKEKIKISYITSLMNDDITRFNTDELRQTLERTTIHNENLSRQVENLKIDLIKAQQKSLINPTTIPISNSNKTIINPDLYKAFDSYTKTGDEEKFELERQNELDIALTQVNKLCLSGDTVVVIFAERYISSFESFADAYIPRSNQNHVILRLPIFNRVLLQAFIKKIRSAIIKIHIPYCENDSIKNAQRAFKFRGIPKDEFKAADAAHAIPFWADIDELCTFRIRQGE